MQILAQPITPTAAALPAGTTTPLPSGWWLLPFLVLGVLSWLALGWAIFG